MRRQVALRLAAGVSCLALTGFGVTACGGSSSNGEASKPAAQILSDAVAATSSVSSVHIAGSSTNDGSHATLNLFDGHSRGGGTLQAPGEDFDLVLISPDMYLKAPAATWTKLAGASAGSLLAGKWLQTTTADADFASFADLLELNQVTQKLAKPSGTLVKGRTATFDGQSAIALVDTGTSGGTLYVAATGKPYILGLVGKASSPGKLTFTDYGKAPLPGRPAGAVNLQQLERSGS